MLRLIGGWPPADTPTAVCPWIPYAPDNGTRAVPGRCAVPGATARDRSAGGQPPMSRSIVSEGRGRRVQSRPHLLADLVDLERLQHMCDSLSAASDMVLAVLDPGGAILVASGWQDICTKFHRLHEETLEGCLESDLQINRRLAEGADAPTHSAY